MHHIWFSHLIVEQRISIVKVSWRSATKCSMAFRTLLPTGRTTHRESELMVTMNSTYAHCLCVTWCWTRGLHGPKFYSPAQLDPWYTGPIPAWPVFNIQILDSARPITGKARPGPVLKTFGTSGHPCIGRRLTLLLVRLRQAVCVPCPILECSADRPSTCAPCGATEQLIGTVVSAAGHVVKLSFWLNIDAPCEAEKCSPHDQMHGLRLLTDVIVGLCVKICWSKILQESITKTYNIAADLHARPDFKLNFAGPARAWRGRLCRPLNWTMKTRRWFIFDRPVWCSMPDWQ